MSIQNAVWISEPTGCESPIFRQKFYNKTIKKAVLDICGLGWFELFINGIQFGDAVFEPAVSTYYQIEGRRLGYKLSDKFVSPRVYYCHYDITDYLVNGENILSAHLGNGWFNQHVKIDEGDFFNGSPRLIFSLLLEYEDGTQEEIKSNTSVLAGKSHIIENNIYIGEVQNLALIRPFHHLDYDESDFVPAIEAAPPEGELTLYTYKNRDKIIRTITPTLIADSGAKKLYDLGENISGRIQFDTSYNGTIHMEFAEEITDESTLDFSSSCASWLDLKQTCTFLGDGRYHTNLRPLFSWQGFRYFTVEGEIENTICQVIHTDLEQTGDFYCDNKRINDLLDMYIRTQLNNIHGSVPSDCPHRERLGYTGDGQITCETVMHLFDARDMYRKWMRDIADCQNAENGHIQHTAPFAGGGGGPAGWGGVVIVLPYVYYKMYGDAAFVEEYWPAMTAYMNYMESRCEEGIVTQEEGGWCLGDWCFEGSVYNLDAPLSNGYVNTCYLVKFYDHMLELNQMLSLGLNTTEYNAKRKYHAYAIVKKYFDKDTGDFCTNSTGANAFALDIGLGDQRTLSNLICKYQKANGFDTGIFGTEILIRLLGQHGHSDLIYHLLSSDKPNHSFGSMSDRGATTLYEYWDGHASHNHPMFGGCVKALWTVFLGINPTKPGYSHVTISPCDIPELGNMGGYITVNTGRLAVDLKRENDKIEIRLSIPKQVEAQFTFWGLTQKLQSGEYTFYF